MEEEKIIVDLSPGTTIQETQEATPQPPPETKQKTTRARIPNVRLEGEPLMLK